ncbi:MAG: LEA type 2 family protein [Myxococcaceae bacterium]
MLHRKHLGLALVLVGAASCATIQKWARGAFEKPTLSFSNARLSDISLTGATLNLEYLLRNPNPIGLTLDEVTYAVLVEDHPMVSGRPPQGLTLPAKGRAMAVFPATVQFAELGAALSEVLTRETTRYRIQGSIGVRTPLGMVSLPLSHEGTFTAPKLPTFALASPRIRDISLTSATLDVVFNVTNPNGFDLPLGLLSGAVAIGGARAGEIPATDLGMLPPSGSREIAIPIRLNLASSLAAANALRQGQGDVKFTGSLGLGQASLPIQLIERLVFRK